MHIRDEAEMILKHKAPINSGYLKFDARHEAILEAVDRALMRLKLTDKKYDQE